MTKLKVQGEYYIFHCPGCEYQHSYKVTPDDWSFNGDMDSPTFTPSLLNTRTFTNKSGESVSQRCHLFITEGKILFQNDCTHALAGQTIDMTDL